MNKTTSYIMMAGALLLASCHKGNDSYDASGIFEATEVIVSAQGTGQLLSFDIQEGDSVTEDVQIGLIDTLQLHYQHQQLVAKSGGIGARDLNVARQVAATRSQLANARSERARFATLAAAGAGNQQTVDNYDNRISVLESQLAAQEEVLRTGNQSLSEEMKGVQAQILQTEDLINKCKIKSPLSGTVLAKYAERGESVVTGKPLFKVADTRHMYLKAYVTAPQLTQIKLGQKVTVYADESEDESNAFDGYIAWISDKAEFTPKTIQTRDERANLVYAIKINVNNSGLIKIGMYGDVRF